MPDDAPMLASQALRAGRLDDTPAALVEAYLKALPSLPKIGAVLAQRWRIERLLGEGGFGAVFEGRDQELGRKVAIKVLRAPGVEPTDAFAMRHAITQMEERRRRFRDEARAVARAESPNVVTVYDVGEHTEADGASWPFLVLELVEGTPLDRVVRERPTPEVALQILAQLAQGVATLHARRVVHRDLKPANAIVTPDGGVKIIDFGLAIAAADWTEIKGPKAPEDWIEGTPIYMSPEVTAGGEPDQHSDLWALGVIAYELLTGRSPWGEHLALPELHRRIAEVDPEPLTRHSGGDLRYLAHVTPIVGKMLAKRPADRFGSANEIVQALADLRSHTTRAVAPARETEQPFRYLLAFEEKDAAWFFGREDVTARLVLALEQRGRLVIAGPSGAGKTSLIQAGLIPELKLLRPLVVLRMQPGRDPLGRLAALVMSLGGDPVTADDLRRRPGLVGERARGHARQTHTRVLVQVDALEELITQEAPAADADVFAQALDGLRDDAARAVLLVMAVRDEYLGRLPRLSRALEPTLRDAEFLGPPPRAAMIAALVRPVERLGGTWEEGFPAEMVDAVAGHASPLPVLQLAASWVWETAVSPSPSAADTESAVSPSAADTEKRARDANVLTRSLLAAPGEALRIGDVLGQYADHKLRAASWSEADRELVTRMLPVMVSGEGTPLVVPAVEILGRVAPEAGARGRELLRDLTDFRLLTSLRDERARECLTPVHTTLIHGWALMREALEGSAELEAFLRRFERDAREWDASGRDAAKLWPAAAVRDFARFQSRLSQVQLSSPQLRFQAAVTALARRARWFRRGLVGGLAALAIGGTWAGFAFAAQADEAQRSRREADALIDFMLGDLRRRLEGIGQIKVLHVVAEKAREYLDARTEWDPDDAPRRAAVLRNLSVIFQAEGDTTRADAAASEAVAVSERLAAERPGETSARNEVARSQAAMGLMFVRRGDATSALERYRSSLAMFEATATAQSDDPALLLELVVVHDRMGDALGQLGETEQQVKSQRAALATAERIVAVDHSNARAKRNVVILRNKAGATPPFPGEGIDARVSPEEFAAFEALAAADPQNQPAQLDLVVGHLGRGNELTARGELAAALQSYRAALAIAERQAAADPDNALLYSDVLFCRNKVGDALQRSGDAPGAVREHEAALAIALRLVTTDAKNARFEQDLAHTWSRLGLARLAARDVPGAVLAQAAALVLSEKLAAAGDSDAAQALLARMLSYHAEALIAAGEIDKARVALTRAGTTLAPLLAKPNVPSAWTELRRRLTELERRP